MGLFSKKKAKQENNEFRWMTVNEALSRKKMKQGVVTYDKVMERCKECCEQLKDVGDQLMETRQEYEAITSYLNDIQKLDDLPIEHRKALEDTARTMIRLNSERLKFQETNLKTISPAQLLMLERYQEDIPKELKSMKEQEQYQQLVMDDMKQIEGERGVLSYEKDEQNSRKKFYKTLSIAACAMIGFFFMTLIVLMEYSKVDMMIPFLLTGIMAILIAIYIIGGIRKVHYSGLVTESKMNRAILLMNKIKLKYVNCTNTIDYMYEKYHVNSHHELEYQWQQFVKIKDEQEMYKKNTELLEFYNGALVEQLGEHGIADKEIWVYQPEALINSKEMVEVRHRLNERRRKVRERLEYIMKHFDIAEAEMKGLIDFSPEYESEIKGMMRTYKVSVG